MNFQFLIVYLKTWFIWKHFNVIFWNFYYSLQVRYTFVLMAWILMQSSEFSLHTTIISLTILLFYFTWIICYGLVMILGLCHLEPTNDFSQSIASIYRHPQINWYEITNACSKWSLKSFKISRLSLLGFESHEHDLCGHRWI